MAATRSGTGRIRILNIGDFLSSALRLDRLRKKRELKRSLAVLGLKSLCYNKNAAVHMDDGIVAKNRNFDRNPLRGCNFGSEGGATITD